MFEVLVEDRDGVEPVIDRKPEVATSETLMMGSTRLKSSVRNGSKPLCARFKSDVVSGTSIQLRPGEGWPAVVTSGPTCQAGLVPEP